MNDWNAYSIGSCIFGGLTFVGSWIYCIAHYGYLLGVGLGWLPSLIVACLVGSLWPLLVLGAMAFAAYAFFFLR